MQYLVYLTYPALVLLLLVGAKWNKKGSWNEEFMSLDQTKVLQGFFAICIMLHHIGQETCAPWQTYKLYPGLEPFVSIGYLFVSLFMLCSGFGLYKSYKQKENYLKGFIGKRILPLIIAFYTTGLLFFAARLLLKEKMNGWKIFCYISGWGLPNLYAWFVVAMPFFYLCFYLCFRFFKWEWLKITGTMAGVFLYTFLGTWVNHNNYWMRGEWWYNSVHLFWIGILFAKYEKPITEWVKKYYILCFVVLLLGALIAFPFSEYVTGVVSYYGEYNPFISHAVVVKNRWICLASQMLASSCFVFFVLVLNLKLKIGNRFLRFMGTVTLEFYLIHGLFLELFSYRFGDSTDIHSIVRITNVALLIVVVFVLSVPAAIGVKKLDNLIYKVLHRSN